MGMVHANIELLNGDDVSLNRRGMIGEEEIKRLVISMLVDSGAIMLTINEEIRLALDLPIIDHRPSQLADGTRLDLPVAGSIVVRFAGRFCTTNALVSLPRTTPGPVERGFAVVGMMAAAVVIIALVSVVIEFQRRELSTHSESRAPELFERRRRLAATVVLLTCGWSWWSRISR